MAELDDEALLRYSRQIMLPDFDIAGQQALADAHALVIGAGGLGSPAGLYLAAAGVGELTISDHDSVDVSNLQRQIAHTEARIGTNKADSIAEQIAELNPKTNVTRIDSRLDQNDLQEIVAEVDVVLDCTDNFDSRFMINDCCWQAGTPLVSAAAIGWEGHISVFNPTLAGSPCYRCLYSEGDDAALNCAENGVIAPLVGILGTCQALEAIKLISQVGEVLTGTVMYFDAKYMEWRRLTLSKREGCATCGD